MVILNRLRTVDKGALAFFAASGAVGLSNFIFHAVISRSIGPSNYSILGALLNVTLVLSVPIGALQVAVTSRVSKAVRAGEDFNPNPLLLKSIALGIVSVLVLALGAPIFNRYLQIGTLFPMLLTLSSLAPSVLGATLQGVMIGQNRFGWVAAANFLGTIIGRLFFGVLLVHFGFGLDGALFSSVLGQTLLTLILLIPVLSVSMRKRGGVNLRVSVVDALLSIGALAGYWAMASVDSFLARHYLGSHTAGIYAASSTASRIALFAPGAIAMVALPQITGGSGDTHDARRAIRWALVGVSLVGFATALVIFMLPSLVLGVLFGHQFLVGTTALRLLAFEAAILGVIGLLSYTFIARRSLLALLPWAAIPLNVLLQFFVKPTMTSLALGVFIVSLVILGAMFVPLIHAMLSSPLKVDPDTQEFPAILSNSSEIDLSIVVPFYNPGNALVTHVSELVNVLVGAGVSFEIIAVSDGSTDGSCRELSDLALDNVRIVEFVKNCGKGDALRAGLSRGVGKYLGFIDADGDIPAELVLSFVEVMRSSDVDFVVGNKRHKDSRVVYPPIRRIYSWGYQQLVRALFQISVPDTQTGIKFARREVVEAVLPLMVEKRFSFDLEMFVVAKTLGFVNVADMPVVIRDRISSTVSLSAVKGMLLDTLGIFYRLHFVRYYDQVERGLIYRESSNSQLIMPSEA